jgi:hypothetical protein
MGEARRVKRFAPETVCNILAHYRRVLDVPLEERMQPRTSETNHATR